MDYLHLTKSLTCLTLTVGLSMTFTSCDKNDKENNDEMLIVADPHSYANPRESRVTHLQWKAKVDFEKEVIQATAKLSLDNSEDADTLILDTKDLTISSVTFSDGSTAEYTLGEKDSILGQPLRIGIQPGTELVSIDYTTSPNAEALQWLNPQQTAGKKHPFLFTQSQAILARSWVPIQDSPGIRFTYSASVTVPENLIALMSASNPQELNANGIYQFEMPQPIPAYLLALAVGDVRFASLGPRSGIYAEPSVLIAAADEFDEMEKMIAAAESLYGAYQWGRYDLLVLPPSFPFGGMENPRLTFITPTVIAGDRSLTSLIAHELAHSWSGNLVTNATWNDFWLNEGFTTYFEMRIMEKLYGKEYEEMLASLEVKELKSEITEMNTNHREEDTHLKLQLEDRSPDEGMNSIAYIKGYLFLRYLEKEAGRKQFDKFLREYFNRNAFTVMTTEEFVEQLNEHLISENRLNIGNVKIEEWIYGPGIPKDADLPVSDRFAKVDTVRGKFIAGASPENLETTNWSSHEWVYFLKGFKNPLDKEQMDQLNTAFKFNETGNSEVLTAWLQLALANNYTASYERLRSFLIKTGRRKFLVPLYQAMLGSPAQKEMALDIYSEARPNYHFVSTNTLDELLNYTSGE